MRLFLLVVLPLLLALAVLLLVYFAINEPPPFIYPPSYFVTA